MIPYQVSRARTHSHLRLLAHAEMEKMNIFTEIIRPDLLGKEYSPESLKMGFAVKANIGSGHLTSASTPSLKDWTPSQISPVVDNLLKAGHEIAAIANMHEMAFGITSENPAYGDVQNPWNPDYTVGGSSGGSAAAVAINAVPFALGTDTGGSMRIPAALCGVVGYRPSTGLYSADVVCPLSSTTDTIGIFAQRVKTIQHVHKIIDPSYSPPQSPIQLKGKRIGVPRQYYYSMLDKEVAQVIETSLECLREAGAQLIEVDIEIDQDKSMMKDFLDLIFYETYHLIPEFLKLHNAPVDFSQLCDEVGDDAVKGALTTGSNISDERYKECQAQAQAVRESIADYFKKKNLDAYVAPVTILPAVRKPSPKTVTVNGVELPTLVAFIHNAIPEAMAGVPAISLPCGLTSDTKVPIGLELVCQRNDDGGLLNMAEAVQAILPALPQLPFAKFQDKDLKTKI